MFIILTSDFNWSSIQARSPQLYEKGTPKQVFSSEFCKHFNNAFFAEHVRMTTLTQSAFTCSKLTIETLEQGVKYVQS